MKTLRLICVGAVVCSFSGCSGAGGSIEGRWTGQIYCLGDTGDLTLGLTLGDFLGDNVRNLWGAAQIRIKDSGADYEVKGELDLETWRLTECKDSTCDVKTDCAESLDNRTAKGMSCEAIETPGTSGAVDCTVAGAKVKCAWTCTTSSSAVTCVSPGKPTTAASGWDCSFDDKVTQSTTCKGPWMRGVDREPSDPLGCQMGKSDCVGGMCTPCYERQKWSQVRVTLRSSNVQLPAPELELWRYGDNRMVGTVRLFCPDEQIQTPKVELSKS